MGKISSLLNLGSAYSNYARGKTVCGHAPLQVWVEPTSVCNLRCPMCPNEALPLEKKGFMDMALFRKIIDDITGMVRNISICHRGEPLLHREICEMIRYAGSKGLAAGIHTNATVLDENLSRRLIESGLSRLSFSFDGFTKEDYGKIRVGADFDAVLGNIVSFLKIKKASGSTLPHVTLQVISMSKGKNTEKKKAFLSRFEGLPLDRVYTKEAHNWAGAAGTVKRPGSRIHRCNSPWYSLVYHWDGSIHPCTLDYLGAYTIGDAGEDSALEAWNSAPMKTLRKEMAAGRLYACSHCLQCSKLYEKKILGISKRNILNEALFRLKWNISEGPVKDESTPGK
ncbi:MAG: radical SAM protein [Candidatus Tritonobacter lacicola]|nr:radical SAM protein [Candidatus Tritonobacter lacicola]